MHQDLDRDRKWVSAMLRERQGERDENTKDKALCGDVEKSDAYGYWRTRE